MVEYIITGELQRTERFDYPLDAIREVVINMVVHRDYRDPAASIIKIFDNRIEFYNPGKLFGGISIHDLLTGNYASKSRNKLIAKAFKEIGLIERYGSGIYRIQKICKDYGVIEPIFEELANGFRVVLFNEKITVGENVGEIVGETVGETAKKIMELLKKNPNLTREEIANQIGLSVRGVEYNLSQLKTMMLIKREGSTKKGKWIIL